MLAARVILATATKTIVSSTSSRHAMLRSSGRQIEYRWLSLYAQSQNRGLASVTSMDDNDDTSLSNTNNSNDESFVDNNIESRGEINYKQCQRIWKAESEQESSSQVIWEQAVDEISDSGLKDVLERIGIQEREGGRMRQKQLGVIREDPVEDMRLLVDNYTAPALASALRDREEILQLCAGLLAEGKLDELSNTLRPFESRYIKRRRKRKNKLDLHGVGGFDTHSLEMLRRGLMRMPRRVSQAHQRRAGVVLPLCNVDGVPCILFEKRSRHLRAHPDEVCLPGGMVSAASDISIVSTCLREMAEEIEGINPNDVTVLGVLRCNWGEVHHLTGIAVTPVVCFIGEIGGKVLKPNPDEVAECFTVPLVSLLDRERWVHRKDYAPIFTGGPHIIWGLTGYIIERFLKDVLARYSLHV
mmetsp:Transcript_4003/g.6075  ORF Transcript_4003/g.6075 Transcript_4003/m.6075 type:complete len:415 (-) Transcript_4003:165-1409(-)